MHKYMFKIKRAHKGVLNRKTKNWRARMLKQITEKLENIDTTTDETIFKHKTAADRLEEIQVFLSEKFQLDKIPNADELYSPLGDFEIALRNHEICDNCQIKSSNCELRHSPLVACREQFNSKNFYLVRAGKCQTDVRIGKEYEEYMHEAGLTSKELEHTFQNFETKNISTSVKIAKGLSVIAADEKAWIVLAGGKGVGKTHLAIAILQQRAQNGDSVRFTPVSELLKEIKAAIGENKYNSVVNKFKDVNCLVLDDLGKGCGTEFDSQELFDLLNYRYRHEKQTVITTNYMNQRDLLTGMKISVFEPLLSRINEMGQWVTISDSEDYRLRKNKKCKGDN